MPPKRCSSRSPSPGPSASPTKKRRIFTSTTTVLHGLQRSYSLPSTPCSPPTGYAYAFPDTPSTSSPSKSHSSTPYPPIPYDSPSNPFGRRRSLAIALPPRTSFRRHVTLRFQFIRSASGSGSAKWKDGGVYRVVQVPLSYTFRHLRILIAWLFGGWCGVDFGLGFDQEEDEDEDADEELWGTRGREKGIGTGRGGRNERSKGPGKGKGKGHLFEVRKKVEMWAPSYRAGAIKRSTTKIRLSSVLDPYRFKEEWEEEKDEEARFWQGEAEDPDAEGETDDEEDELAGEDPRWEAEEDFTLEHVWNDPDDDDADADDDKPKLKPVGIVYYHTPSSSLTPTQIHVTLHDKPVQPRTGRGNTPTVIKARGHVFLQPPPPSSSPLAEEEELEQEDTDCFLIPEVWEENDGFEGYLAKVMPVSAPPPILETGVYRHSVGNQGSSKSTPSLQSTPSLAPDFSSSPGYPLSSSSPLITIPFPTSSPPVGIRRSVSLTSTSPRLNLVPKNTPALPAAQRKRSAYLRKRIERSRQRTRSRPKRGGERTELEEREKVMDRGSDEEREKVEVDELAKEDEEEEEEEEEEKMARKLEEEMQNQDDEDAEGEDEDDGLMVRSADGTWLTIKEAARRIVEEKEV
ncbi:hypothetical protein V5O48_006371 [Marasmius crinis-equi]|uniref:Uncharacterized protein n=1 Tax=Marasmius crinis-equi TaxID=585013 RepID=A0ABR3FJP5_9AGAR